MPKMKTSRAAEDKQSSSQEIYQDRNRPAEKEQSLQESHPDQEVHEEEEESAQVYDHRPDERVQHEEDPAVYLIGSCHRISGFQIKTLMSGG